MKLQKHTGGNWKPSPGSIYPMLLAWLQDNQYIKELPHENGLKRYELTQTGKESTGRADENHAKNSEPKSDLWQIRSLTDSAARSPKRKTIKYRSSMKRSNGRNNQPVKL